MILFSSDLKKNILLHQYLNINYKDNLLLKNNLIYFNHEDKLDLTKEIKLINDNLSDYLYYYLNKSIDIKIDNIVKINEFGFSDDVNFEILDEFEYIPDVFFSKGNVAILYFSSKYIRNPLDVLYTIIENIEITNKYYDVKIDYLIYRDKIIYYILFRYSLSSSEHLKEIGYIKDTILNIKDIVVNKTIFPIIQQEFESKFLDKFPDIDNLSNNIVYEGMSIFTPYKKIV